MDRFPTQSEARRGAGIVPAAVIGFVVGLVVGVMALVMVFSLVVVPVLNGMFANMAAPLPALIRGLLDFSMWVKDMGWPILAVAIAALVVAMVFGVKWLRTSASRGQV